MRDEVYLARGAKTRIRPFFRSDVDRWLAWPDHSDPLYVAYNPHRMPGWRRDAWFRDLVERQRQQPFAVEELGGEMIGRIFLRHVHRAQGVAVLGVDFHPGFVGRGYGTDALRAFLRYYFFEQGFRQLLLSVAAYNERARRAYVRCGFETVGGHWDRHDPRLLELLRQPEYRALRAAFRQTAQGLEVQFEDMLLTAERFKSLEASDGNGRS
ncbi:MAG: GNAT family N-acetyltransferase [Chloroflexi bacterium]|nr:GNAT family N-acetyltransferase [Chloroflexota bacterium]